MVNVRKIVTTCAIDTYGIFAMISWCNAGVGSLFTITGRMNCALSLAYRKIN